MSGFANRNRRHAQFLRFFDTHARRHQGWNIAQPAARIDQRGRRRFLHDLDIDVQCNDVATSAIIVRRQHRNAVRIDPASVRIDHNGRRLRHMLRLHTPCGQHRGDLFTHDILRRPHDIIFIDMVRQSILPGLILRGCGSGVRSLQPEFRPQ